MNKFLLTLTLLAILGVPGCRSPKPATDEPTFCQSCGMPLQKSSDFGTEADNTPSSDYCSYCYQYGKFTVDCTMEEMIAYCSQFYMQFRHADGSQYTREEAVSEMREVFPTLKRWQAAAL